MLIPLIRLVVISLILFTSALIPLDSTVTATPPQKQSVANQAGDLFRNNCARCHGADGAGDTPLGHTYNVPDFADSDWWRKQTAITSTRSLVSIVSHGRGGMPAFGKKLTSVEIRRLVDYVRGFRNQKSPKATP